ncbi:helix-turn-helix domain-containing protein [Ensifer sp.]|uniref:helix-turn-helix domain-containing protein n=1 Tax=Ensifer sp. TaxID=1872086 RepID=UPI00289F1C4A|nr:helix-turn-helix domain-containing protein [Ensifer sp.]
MDSLITAAARALAAGDLLGALKRVALRDDPPALALRGIAMAQLGDYARAKALLKTAARAFGPREAVARARCVVAEAEIALVSRDLGFPEKALETARATLEAHQDRINAAHARHLQVRRLVLVGRLDEAEKALSGLDPTAFSPAHRAAHALIVAGIAMRRLRTQQAREALAKAREAAREAKIAALDAEVEEASAFLATPAARLVARGEQRVLLLAEVEALLASGALVVDACRHGVRAGDRVVSLASRPVLFALARTLGEAWPDDVSRGTLLARAFGARHADETHRARLRVEIGRLRAELCDLAEIRATTRGFVLVPIGAADVAVMTPPEEGQHGAVLALLADGEAWASSALAMALGASPRTVLRALDALSAAGKVLPVGQGRARRWMTPPMPGFPTVLLLPGPLPSD